MKRRVISGLSVLALCVAFVVVPASPAHAAYYFNCHTHVLNNNYFLWYDLIGVYCDHRSDSGHLTRHVYTRNYLR